MKLRELRIQKGLKQNEFARLVGVSNMCMCLLENYKCLPVPQAMEEMCKVLDCESSDIYERHEIALKVSQKHSKNNANNIDSDVYRMTANLPRRAQQFFKDNLQKLGYKSITEWANSCFEKLEKQAKNLEKTKKKDLTQARQQKSKVHNVKRVNN